MPDLEAQASKYFKWKELLYLSHWDRYASASDGLNDEIIENLVTIATRVDAVRDFLMVPLYVTSGYRPPAYSKLVGGFETDVHTMGLAIDCTPQGIGCEDARMMIESKLDQFQIRMENNGPNGNWLHFDAYGPLPGHKRFFLP